MPAQADRILSLMERLRLQEVDVVGCSWGGAIAMLLAAQSAKVRSLVLAAPVNPWSTLGSGRIRFLNGGRVRPCSGWFGPFPVRSTTQLWPGCMAIPSACPLERLQDTVSQIMRPGRVNNILNTLRSWEKDVHALRVAIPQIKVRSLLIWGTRDSAVDVRSAEPLKQALPQCQLKIIEGAGHLPFEETPDEFNRLVLDFIDQR